MESDYPAPPPISKKRLNRIATYLDQRYETTDVLARHEIQYGLSETGPFHVRLDPREVEIGLCYLGNNRNPGDGLPHGPWRPRRDIYVSPRIARTGSKSKAGILAATRAEHLTAFAKAYRDNRAYELGKEIASRIEGSDEIEIVDEGRAEALAGSIHWSAAGSRFGATQVSSGEKRLIWVTNNMGWIFPDDPGLWKHLSDCIHRGAFPIVLTRKAPIATFVLLKRLGGFGLQLHHLFLPGPSKNDRLVARALNGGPPVIRADGILQHTAIREYLPAALSQRPPRIEGSAEAVQLGLEVGLGDALSADPRALRKWLERTGLDMPQPWKAQLTRYLRWRSYVKPGDGAS
jgi:hypothetical protein